MATKFTKPVLREVTVQDARGRGGQAVVTLHSWGVTLRGKGTHRKLNITWAEMAQGMCLGSLNVIPPRFMQNRLGWLLELQRQETANG